MQFDNRPPQNGRPEGGGGRRRRSRRRRGQFPENGAPSAPDVFTQPEFPQPVGPPLLSEQQLDEMSKAELNELAKTFDVENPSKVKKDELIAEILEIQARRSGLEPANGVLDILPEGYGFLRRDGYLVGPADIYISQSQIRRFDLRRGDLVAGQVRAPKENEKYYGIVKVESINGCDPETSHDRRTFDELLPETPAVRWDVGRASAPAVRAIDVFAPIPRGGRALILAPVEADTTRLIAALGTALSANHPGLHVITLLVDQRPEDATRLGDEGEAVATTFDDGPDHHVATTELVIERAKRLIEIGRDVVVLADSLTRLARAYAAVGGRGERERIGVDHAALQKVKRLFAVGRAAEGGGSLTFIGVATAAEGPKADAALVDELTAMASTRIVYAPALLDARIDPAIDVRRSWTRGEDALLSEIALRKVVALRRTIRALGDVELGERIADALGGTRDADEFLSRVGADGTLAAR